MNVWQILNVISLDAHRDSKVTLRDTPIHSITDVYKGAEP
jgi:hypothetical protein